MVSVVFVFFSRIRRPPRSTQGVSSAASDVYKRQGLSIGAYVRKLRMEKALEFIESGQFSILQVALYVGYSNPSHFSEAFKRYHGRLPSFYTRKKRSLRHPDSAMGRQHCPVR
eukprot:TRINITY_DN29868_c0_g1_i1.p3 TRINITY_DN29868_c0_g1~~TRINITY_DN29868_c0_g1_i1.p3  ORF type:complete len:113 (-),score=28.07 TRINITY_DN29868_c0_g1_i1:84-422(-)